MAKCENAFIIFHDWEKAFAIMDGDECKRMLMAMFAYSKKGTEPPEFEGVSEMAASFIFPAMQRHNERVKIGRAGGLKRAENAAVKAEEAEQEYISQPDADNLKSTSSVLEDNLKLTSPICEDNLNTSEDNFGYAQPLRQDIRQDKDIKQNINYLRQDEDKTIPVCEDNFNHTADVSSVIGQAIEICDWLEVPSNISSKTSLLITNSGYTIDDYRQLFKTANECTFLRGSGDRGWKANFDWLIEHMDEVISGKYRSWDRSVGTQKNDYYNTSRYENPAW